MTEAIVGRRASGVAFALVRFPARAIDRRGAEHVAGLLAVKRAALLVEPAWTLDELEVVRRHDDGPLLRRAGRDSGLWVSVTHADGVAVAAVAGSPARGFAAGG